MSYLIEKHITSRIQKSGVAALPAVVVIALIVLLAGIGIVGTGLVENALTFGEGESRQALYAAESGIHDTIERLARNKDCNNGGTPACTSYSFTVGEASVSITVSGASSPKTILATGTKNNKIRRVQVVVAIDTNNKITVSSWSELTD